MLWTYLGAALILLVIARLALGLGVRLLQARADARRQALLGLYGNDPAVRELLDTP